MKGRRIRVDIAGSAGTGGMYFDAFIGNFLQLVVENGGQVVFDLLCAVQASTVILQSDIGLDARPVCCIVYGFALKRISKFLSVSKCV